MTDGQRERLRVQADGRIFGDVDRVELTESTRG